MRELKALIMRSAFQFRRLFVNRFELWEIFRKLVLISVLSAISPKSTTYLYTAHVVSFFAVLLFAYTKPYVEPAADQLQFVTLGVTTLSFFYGIMVKAPDGGVDSAIDSNEQTAKVAHPSRLRLASTSSRSGGSECRACCSRS